MNIIYERMRELQIKYKTEVLGIKDPGMSKGENLHAHLLPREQWEFNLWEGIRNQARSYFGVNGIAWHAQRHNLLSSQAMCINVFFPLRNYLDILGMFLSQYFPDLQQVIYLDFEYIGPRNYFKERGGRGQNRTSADIVVIWSTRENKMRMLLVEFKFTEADFGECARSKNPNQERCLDSRKVVSSPQKECYRAIVGRTYWNIILSADSPVRKEFLTMESFCPFHYDFYQLMRNQLLAHCLQSDERVFLSRVDFAVFYHAENSALLQMKYPFGGETNPFKAWPKILNHPETFHIFTVQDFLKSIEPHLPDTLFGWHSYLKRRYGL